jgi:hypothetical protein
MAQAKNSLLYVKEVYHVPNACQEGDDPRIIKKTVISAT